MIKENNCKIFKICIEKLKNDWIDNIKPFIEFDKNQGQKYDKFIQDGDVVMKREPEPKEIIRTMFKIPSSELHEIYSRVYTDEACEGSPYDIMGEIKNMFGLTPNGETIPINLGKKRILFFNEEKAKYFEQRKIASILKSFFFQYIQKIAVEVERAMLIVCSDYIGDERFSIRKFYDFSDKFVKESEAIIRELPKFKAFDLLLTMNNFLKHNSISAYKELKEYYPKNIDFRAKTPYENGMYAGDFIYL